jgi:hypothetical protein
MYNPLVYLLSRFIRMFRIDDYSFKEQKLNYHL